jgi:hypothetical protein
MYPVTYEADYQERPNRWKTGFRFILVIPWLILLRYIYPIAAGVIVFIAWFALLFTARYPKWAYDFNAGFIRFQARVNAFTVLQTDAWPSFGFDDDPRYPIRVQVAPALERYSRAKVFFRAFLLIPAVVVGAMMGYFVLLASVISWFTIVFRGYLPPGMHNALSVGIAYGTRFTAYMLLLTERLPPVSDQGIAPTTISGATTPALAETSPVIAAPPSPVDASPPPPQPSGQ